jgi:hypothetical protein
VKIVFIRSAHGISAPIHGKQAENRFFSVRSVSEKFPEETREAVLESGTG